MRLTILFLRGTICPLCLKITSDCCCINPTLCPDVKLVLLFIVTPIRTEFHAALLDISIPHKKAPLYRMHYCSNQFSCTGQSVSLYGSIDKFQISQFRHYANHDGYVIEIRDVRSKEFFDLKGINER